MSLRQLSDWCAERFRPHNVGSETRTRPFDVPWLVLDPGRANAQWRWRPQTTIEDVLEEIAAPADAQPNWLATSQ
jgi:CDP-paratose 2-epimerase